MSKEKWMPVVGFEGLYEVSDTGRVRSVDRMVGGGRSGGLRMRRSQPIALTKQKCGYLMSMLYCGGKERGMLVHRMVATAFIPNPRGLPQVNHKNGIKTDNTVENLEWVTASANSIHAYATGLVSARGSQNGQAKLGESDIQVIRKLFSAGLSNQEIADRYGVHRRTISDVRRGITWYHVPPEAN